MRYSKEHKRQTRQRIIDSAYRLFSSKGFEATSIEEIMFECHLTRGGFYAHFKSKSQLYHYAIGKIAPPSMQLRVGFDDFKDATEIESILDEYLNATSGDAKHNPYAFLATDISNNEPAVRSAYSAAVGMLSEKIRHAADADNIEEETSLSIAAMIVGALSIAQSVDDAELKSSLLSACKKSAQALLNNARDSSSLNFFWAPMTENRLS